MSINFNFLDELPKDWETARVKNILDYNHHYPIGDGDHGSIKPEMYQDDGIPYLRVQNLSWGFDINYDNLVYISNEVNQDNSKSILIPKDILIAKTGATVGKMAIVPESMKQANTTSSVGKVTVNHKLFDYKYFAYLFSSSMFQEQIKEKAYQKSAQPGFNIDDLIEFSIIIPPINFQHDIVNYLDNRTSKIDATIAKNEELIELLEQKRIALINQAVTKGLNPNIPMKDSGIDWIGEIPKKWKIIKLKFCADIINKKKDFATVDDKYVGLEHIESKTGKLLNYSNQGADGSVNIFKKDMVLFGKLRPYLSKAIISSFDGVCSTELLVFKTKNFMLPSYLFYIMLSNRFIEQVNSSTYGVKMPRASPEFINNLYIALPSKAEQEEIVSYLNLETSKIDEIISKVNENINLLEEYKSSLIHHAVTGKINVRCEV